MKSNPLLLVALLSGGCATSAPLSLNKAGSRFIDCDQVRLHYKVLGSGEPTLVLVHGWSCDMSLWREQVKGLAPLHRLVLIDLPGHGSSAAPAVNYSQERFARAVEAVLREEHIDHAFLAGHSMGTQVIRQFYRLFPLKTDGLIAVDGSVRAFFTDPKAVDAFLGPLRGEQFAMNMRARVDGILTPVKSEALKAEVREVMTRTPQHVVVSAGEGMFDPAIWTDDPIEVPLLLILARSPFWNDEFRAYVERLAPQADYRVIDDVSHFLMLEKPETVNAMIEEFVRRPR